jgi:CRP-like cAMP-binding protein
MEKFKNIIRNIYPVSDSSINLLLPHIKKKTYRKNDFIIKAGEIRHEVYFICEGLISMNFIHNNEEYVAGIYKKNECVPSSMSFYKEEESHAFTLIPIKDSSLYVLSKDSMQKLYREDREIAYLIITMADYLFIKSVKVNILLKCYSPINRYKSIQEEFSDTLNDIPIKTFASLIGITDTSLSRIRNQLTKEKMAHKKKETNSLLRKKESNNFST